MIEGLTSGPRVAGFINRQGDTWAIKHDAQVLGARTWRMVPRARKPRRSNVLSSLDWAQRLTGFQRVDAATWDGSPALSSLAPQSDPGSIQEYRISARSMHPDCAASASNADSLVGSASDLKGPSDQAFTLPRSIDGPVMGSGDLTTSDVESPTLTKAEERTDTGGDMADQPARQDWRRPPSACDDSSISVASAAIVSM